LGEEFKNKFRVLIVRDIHHFLNTRRDDVFTTIDTGKVSYVDSGALYGGSSSSRVGDGVLLRMNGVLLMAVKDDTPPLPA
jgi:hypothetical protein